ncbi:hypothetical protein DMH15_42325, partial [Streptomyces sp. WAC 06725]
SGGDWTPHVVLAEQLPDGPATRNLVETLTEQPPTASAVITASAPDGLPEEAWTLNCHGPDASVVLPGSGLPIRLQTLDDDRFRDPIELLTTADTDSDVPASDWTRAAAEDDPSEDGLPDEYAAIERDTLDDEPTAPTTTGGRAAPKVEERVSNSSPTGSGESLADVLALEGDGTHEGEIPVPCVPAGPADVALPLTSPCASAPAAVRATVPLPAAASVPASATEPDEPSADTPPSETGPISPSVLLL